MAGENSSVVLELKDFSIFKELDADDVKALGEHIASVDYDLNKTVFTEGEAGDAMYFVRSGAIKILKNIKDDVAKKLNIIKPGEFIGEMSLLDGQARSSSAQALVNSSLYRLKRDDFFKLLSKNSSTAIKLLRGIMDIMSQRLRQANNLYKEMIIWGVDEKSIKKKVREVIEAGTTVKILLFTDRDITGKILNFEEGLGGLEILIEDPGGLKYLVPYHSVQYILTRGKKSIFDLPSKG